jgi:hypothetical protein
MQILTEPTIEDRAEQPWATWRTNVAIKIND